MPFVLFHDLFPEVAEEETRTIKLMENAGRDSPPGDYSFLEMFCNEQGCDCRRVLFSVVSSRRPGMLAVVNWGWEKAGFYAKWLKGSDRGLASYLRGPSLNVGSPQSDLAPAVLKLTEGELLKDKAYRDRIKRHYAMIRKGIERRQRSPVARLST